ncbi:MAG: hypothetical protein ABIG37_00040 [Nanoarchaeota archaeon]|nr:hypothetical protein [Nanoarchaeota archaeon]
MYSLPQEIEVWYIIPAIRRELSKVLTKKYGMTFEKTGNALGISKAAVSQYLKKKRANVVKFPEKVKKEIMKSAEIIQKNEKKALKEILRLLFLIKKSGCSCKVCKRYNKGVLSQCRMNPIRGE